MIELPFGKNTLYKKYKKSFLQQAVVILRFESPCQERIDKGKWDSYLQNNFFLKMDRFFADEIVGISKTDKSVDYLFSKDQIAFRIQGKDYVSFSDTIIPHVYKMRKFFKEVVELDTIVGLEIRKWDAWQVKSDKENDELERQIQNFFLSPDFFESKNDLDTPRDLIPEEKLIKAFKWSDESTELRLNSSMLKPTKETKLYSLILYSDCKEKKRIKVDKIEDELELANFELFKIFNWSISDNTRALMEA